MVELKNNNDSVSSLEFLKLVKDYCFKLDLSTSDPYDIWKTNFGVKVKDLFNRNRLLGGGPALIMTLYDHFINNEVRIGYQKQEYPIVRAFAAQILLNFYEISKDKEYLKYAITHLDWLVENSSNGYSGYCWGLGFKWAVYNGVIYEANTPHSTHTPYALEAFDLYSKITEDLRYENVIKSCFDFYEKDLQILCENESSMAISYGPFKDRPINNAVSYTLFAYSIFLDYFPEKEEYIKTKISKFYRFLVNNQLENGAWYYAPLESNSFIDCFHSCIIIKNLYKARMRVNNLEKSDKIIKKGYQYILSAFYDENMRLFKRFTKTNKFSMINFDLYDNAEVLALSKMMGDVSTSKSLENRIAEVFVKNKNEIYSSINLIGGLINKNTLRWAVMPYLFSLSIQPKTPNI